MSELGLLSLTQLQKSAQDSQSNPRSVSWMWNPKQQGAGQDQVVDDDSWEVRAFAEDTGNVMGTTWPPRSYTCTFCRREFRSAQALGGHMNVHRRDRARLHQVQQQHHHPAAINSSSGTTCPSSFIIPTQEFLATNGGLCLLYQLPNPNNINGAAPLLHHESSSSSASSVLPSTLLSISPNNLPLPPHDYLMTSSSACPRTDSHCHQYYVKGSSADQDQPADSRTSWVEDIEELDLELRLGPS